MSRHVSVPEKWDLEVDLAVVGSSSGGLTAACKAHELGLTTVVLEKAATLGGGTAFSGGVIWIPCNHHMVEEGIPDSREAALEHIRYLKSGEVYEIERFLLVREQAEGLLFHSLNHCLCLFQVHLRLSKIRQSPFPLFSAVPLPTNDPRFYVAGRALIGGLLLGCIQKGIDVLDSTPARQLIVQDGRVIGLRAEREGKDFFVKASKGVLLATGGYEWNAEMNKRYIRVPEIHGITPPSNSGDGHVMGMEVGGAVALMDFSLFMPTVRIPGDEIDGEPMYRIWQFNIGQPGNILVNKEGKRCCDEAFYPDIGRAFEEMDAQKLQPANLPMFWIVDQNFRDRIPVGPLPKGTEMADWLHKGDTVEELAEKLGLPPANLKETLERFNEYAREGLDPDFHRGETGYDKRWGFWPNRKPNPVLSPLEKPPFYGMQLYVGTVGNLGGLVTNTNAQVIDAEGNPIPGLYATSNAAAPLATGVAYTSGMTGGKAMIFGWLAAQHAAGVAPEAAKEVAKAPVPERQVAAPEAAGAAVAASGQTAAESTLASTAESTSVEAIRGKGIQILNEDGSSVLDLEGIEKAGDRLCMKGKLMGSFSTNMYLDASGFYRMLRMLIGPATIAFALLSPIYWLKERKTRKQ